MNKFLSAFAGLRMFFIVWSTQNLSILGSSMTSFALVIWSYQQKGSALTTAGLSVASYAPYVLLSVFAGSLVDRWDKRKTLVFCDLFAALSTVAVLVLLKTGRLEVWHLYGVNALNGLMNTIQQPASELAVTLLTPREQVQRVGGLRSLSSSLTTLLAPALATAVLTLAGLEAVIAIDLVTCGAAVGSVLLIIRFPEEGGPGERVPVLRSAREGVQWLRRNRGIVSGSRLCGRKRGMDSLAHWRGRLWREWPMGTAAIYWRILICWRLRERDASRKESVSCLPMRIICIRRRLGIGRICERRIRGERRSMPGAMGRPGFFCPECG